MLTRIGLEFFVASRPKEYVAKACALAQNPEALLDIRYSMRRRMTSGTLCNAKFFAHSVEAAYRKMWYKWCRSRNSEIRTDEL
ncbi:MAG: hypothetical protein ACYSUD_12135 [Planctomycetota bacterium]|jgi:predicted O-linked N-acetylglucosamine transferase (SPINDLY family)